MNWKVGTFLIQKRTLSEIFPDATQEGIISECGTWGVDGRIIEPDGPDPAYTLFVVTHLATNVKAYECKSIVECAAYCEAMNEQGNWNIKFELELKNWDTRTMGPKEPNSTFTAMAAAHKIARERLRAATATHGTQ